MGLDEVFSFGKHAGRQVEDVLDDDREYIVWLIEEKNFDFDEEVMEKVEKNKY